MLGFIEKCARFFALLGGIVLSALIVMTCFSIAGRSLNSILHSDILQASVPGLANGLLELGVGPINGDFEILEAGMAFAIFAFLPLCQMHGGHASVDIFTSRLPIAVKRGLLAVIEVAFAAVMVLIAFQLFQGMLSKQASGQTTFLLEFPVWWSYLASLMGAIGASAIAILMAGVRVVEAFVHHDIYHHDDAGAGH